MKKICTLIVLLLSLSLIEVTEVKALTDSFYEAEYVNDAYIKKFKPGADTGRYQQMRVFRRSSDQHVAYCIEIWKELLDGKPVIGYQEDFLNRTNLSEEIWERVELLAYYGYGYQSHTSLDWYAVTQYLIWKTIEPDSTIYFTDKLNGNRIDKYQAEIAELERLVEKHNQLPSFVNQKYQLTYNEEYVLTDTNQVLENFIVQADEHLMVKKVGNELRLTTKHLGKSKLTLTKKASSKTTLYVDLESQSLIVRGGFSQISSEIEVELPSSAFQIRKRDKQTGSTTPQGEASFTGTTFELFNQDRSIVKQLIIQEDGYSNIIELPYGKYQIKEIKSGAGYQLDPKPKHLTIDESDLKLVWDWDNEVYKGKIIIQKFYGSSEKKEYFEEENAEFEIYNSKNERIETIITNEDGKAEIELPYGTYRIVQIKGKNNYELSKPFTVTISETSEKEQSITLKNEEIGYRIKVIKLDADSKLPIKDKIKFKIKNKETGEYLVRHLTTPIPSETTIFETNDEGYFITDMPLLTGTYLLEEVSAPFGYQQQTEPLEFTISEETETISDSLYGEVILVEVENQRAYGMIEIEKQGEVMMTTGGLSFRMMPLEGVEFSIYAGEEIKAKDGTILYQKDQLVEILVTNREGLTRSSKLPLGKYYVIETKNLEPYDENNHKYFVDLTTHSQKLTLAFENTLKKSDIEIIKIDANTKARIGKAKFSLYTENKEYLGSVYSDQDGKAYFYDIPLGKYYVIEEEAPLGYEIDKNEHYLEIVENQKTYTLTIPNRKIELPPKTGVSITQDKTNHSSLIFLGAIGIFLGYRKIKQTRI